MCGSARARTCIISLQALALYDGRQQISYGEGSARGVLLYYCTQARSFLFNLRFSARGALSVPIPTLTTL